MAHWAVRIDNLLRRYGDAENCPEAQKRQNLRQSLPRAEGRLGKIGTPSIPLLLRKVLLVAMPIWIALRTLLIKRNDRVMLRVLFLMRRLRSLPLVQSSELDR